MEALERRVRDLTHRVRASEQDASAARILAGAADRDVSDMRFEIREFREHNTRVLNAMREDLTTVREDLTTRMDSGFADIRARLDQTAAGQQQIADLLGALLDRPGRPVLQG